MLPAERATLARFDRAFSWAHVPYSRMYQMADSNEAYRDLSFDVLGSSLTGGKSSSYIIAVRTGATSELKTAGEAIARWLRPSIALLNAFTTRI